jgi:hypothetical protein
MRILKYIFLLLLLALVGTTVYVATQKGDFKVTKSSIIKTPRSTVFNYVNDYKNFHAFYSSFHAINLPLLVLLCPF